MWRAIDIALRKNAPSSIPTSGERALQNDWYVVYFLDRDSVMWFLANEMYPAGLTGKWSIDGKNFDAQCSVPYSALGEYTLFVQHYYRGWVFYSHGLPSFHWKFLSGYPFWRVWIDRGIQAVFNTRSLPRRDRMKVLSYILAETVKDRDYEAHATGILTHFYSVRWVHRPDQEELRTYYGLLLESLNESADLAKGQYGYKMKPKALNTLATFEQEERRHGENNNTQRGIYALTAVLMVVGIIQAISSAIEAWDALSDPEPASILSDRPTGKCPPFPLESTDDQTLHSRAPPT